MGNPIKKLQEKRIDNLYQKKKAATASGDMKKKEKLDKKITSIRSRSLSSEDFLKKGGSVKKKKK